MFNDPNTRPKAIGATILIGGLLAYGAYKLWANQEEVSADVRRAAHNLGHAAKSAEKKAELGVKRAEEMLEEQFHKISQKLNPPKVRVEEFKKMHLQRFVEVKNAAIKEDHDAILDYTALSRLQQLAIEMSEKEFKKVVKLNREHRRRYLDHEKQKYEEIVIHGEKDFEEIFTQNLNAILTECGVSQEKYRRSVAEHIKTNDKVYLEGPALYDVMIGRLPAVNEPVMPSVDYVADIHQFMLEQYHKIFYKPLRKEYYTDIKEKMLLDKVWEKYGVEEEDLIKLRKNFDSFEVRDLKEKLNTLIIKDENQFGNYPSK